MIVSNKHNATADDPGEALDAPGNASHTPTRSRKPLGKPQLRKRPPLQLAQAQQVEAGETYRTALRM